MKIYKYLNGYKAEYKNRFVISNDRINALTKLFLII